MGNGFLPLMPIYAQQCGATTEIAGYYVGFAFLCVSAGSLLGGRLSDRLSRRRFLLAAAGLVAIPATWLVGRVGNVWQLALATGVLWLIGGLCLGVVGAIAGTQAGENERGRVFGILGMMISLGALAGGLTIGRMVDAWGYPGMFTAVALLMAIIPAAALLLVSEGSFSPLKKYKPSPKGAGWLSIAFLLLLLSELLAMVAGGTGNMGRSLLMDEKAFTSAAITTTMAVGGIVSLPLPFALGWISDKVGRKSVLIASCIAGIAGLLLLIVARSLWQFSAAAALLSIHAISMTTGPAYVTDIVRPERVGTGVSLMQSAAWIGTILGYVYSGLAFPRLGMIVSLWVGSLFPLLAIPVLLLVRTAARSREGRETSPN
jgi:MFS family permease